MKVKIKVLTEEGKYCLQEIKGLKEGSIVEGTRTGNRIDIVWNGEPASLWLNENCVICKKANRLPKGWMLDVICRAYDSFNNHWYCSYATKQEVLDEMRERGYKRDEYSVDWIVRDYSREKDIFGDYEGIGETREEAIRDFWRDYNSNN